MNGYGNSVFLRTAWEVSGGVPPVNTVAPAITGTAQEGQIVTCSTGTWTGTPTITFAYQWKRNGSNIGSATNSTYTLVTADVSQSITCQVTATNGAGSASATSNTITPIAAVDPDAQAFITAAAITDPTQQAAINTLVVDLKGYNVWTKMKAVYPFVGSTASQHKFNLKDPRDLDAAFRLVFNGGWTHSVNGALPNGTNAYADTKLIPNTVLSANSAHLSYYSRTNSAVLAEIAMGILNGSTGGNGLNLVIRRDTNVNSFRATETGAANGLVNSTSTDSRGFTSGSITSATSRKLYKNGTLLNTNTNNYTWDRASNNIMIGAAYNTGNSLVEFYTNKETAFASIGDGLLDSEANNLYLCVQQFNTTLGRQV
jgi:hypothetical protein